MEWQFILALILVIPIILFPVVFIWYLNAGGVLAAVKEGRLRALSPLLRKTGIGLAVILPVGVYGFLIWFFLGNFGWQVALAAALVLPIVLLVPVLVWATVVSGLYQVARDTLRRRVTVSRRRAPRVAEATVPRRVV